MDEDNEDGDPFAVDSYVPMSSMQETMNKRFDSGWKLVPPVGFRPVGSDADGRMTVTLLWVRDSMEDDALAFRP